MTNVEIADLIEKAKLEFFSTSITYPAWLGRVNSGYYSSKGIDPVKGTAWGRGFAYQRQAISILTAAPTPVPPPPVIPPPPNPLPAGSINTWEYGQAIEPRLPSNPKYIDVTTISDLSAKWQVIQPGQIIRGHGLRNSGQLRLENKNLPGDAAVDLSDDCLLSQPGNTDLGSLFYSNNSRVHLVGADCTGAQLLTYDLQHCDLVDCTIDKSRGGGLVVFGITRPVKDCFFREKISNSSYGCHPNPDGTYYITPAVAATDPHGQPGTGIHGVNIGDSKYWVEDCRFALDLKDIWSGAGIELSNLRKGDLGTGCEFWVRGDGLHQYQLPVNGQVCGNLFQFWGSTSMITDAVKVHYYEVNNAQGKAIEAGWTDGPFSGVVVEKGTYQNVCLNPLLKGASPLKQYPGIIYL